MDPLEAIVSLGNYNAFPFNDGLGDSLGTVRGVPVPPDQAVTASPDLVTPDLVDLGGAARRRIGTRWCSTATPGRWTT